MCRPLYAHITLNLSSLLFLSLGWSAAAGVLQGDTASCCRPYVSASSESCFPCKVNICLPPKWLLHWWTFIVDSNGLLHLWTYWTLTEKEKWDQLREESHFGKKQIGRLCLSLISILKVMISNLGIPWSNFKKCHLLLVITTPWCFERKFSQDIFTAKSFLMHRSTLSSNWWPLTSSPE